MNPQELRELVLARMGPVVLGAREQFQALTGERAYVAVEGSMACGTFLGPRASRNPTRKGELVTEIDYSLRVSDAVNPHDDNIVQIVEKVSGGKLVDRGSRNGWHQNVPTAMFYCYVRLPDVPYLVEVDLCVQREGECCELSDYWDRLFRAREINDQRLRRERAEQLGTDQYSSEKWGQNEEAKWRLLYGFATGLFSPVPINVREFVDRWYLWTPDLAPSDAAPLWVRDAYMLGRTRLDATPPADRKKPGDQPPQSAQ